jgi:Ca2+-binding RTX toxin-like protein
VIHGGSGPEVIYGDVGNDTIYAGSGPDTIYGGHGNHEIHGGSGSDYIVGGPGHNTIYTGSGPDHIVDAGPNGHDTVYGFDPHGGHDDISFVGENAHTIHQVVATAEHDHGNTTLNLPDGSTMTLVGVHHIDASFFH